MNRKKPSIYFLEQYGLNAAQLVRLGDVKIKVRMCLRHINEKSLFKLQPKARIEKMKRHYKSLFSRVKKNWSDGPLDISWIRHQPRAFSASVEANRIPHFLRMPEIGSIWIDEISGRKRATTKPKERWFAVKARFAIQIEGRTKGLQSYEDRTVIVKALTFEDAERKLQPEFKRYGTPYLNPRGFMVEWVFERVLDCFEIGDEEFDPRGTEVFSELNKRRMKPAFVGKKEKGMRTAAKQFSA